MEKHSEKSPVLIPAVAARHVNVCASCVWRALAGCSPRGAAVRVRAGSSRRWAALSARSLCVSPAEVWSNRGVTGVSRAASCPALV